MSVMVAPVPWYGGKAQWADWIVAHLPPHRVYVEVFGGSGAVLFSKRPAALEVFNDLHEGITHFYRVLRDPDLFPRLQIRVALQPYARADFEAWRGEGWRQGTDDPVEQAARWWFVARTAFSGNGAAPNPSWSFNRTPTGDNVRKWLEAIDHLPAWHARLRRVQIDRLDWREVLNRYDGPDTVFYCDPPYVPETRVHQGSYQHELTLADHADLVAALLALRGQAILSGYVHPVYAPLEAAGWRRLVREVPLRAQNSAVSAEARRQECLWISPGAQAQMTWEFPASDAGEEASHAAID